MLGRTSPRARGIPWEDSSFSILVDSVTEEQEEEALGLLDQAEEWI